MCRSIHSFGLTPRRLILGFSTLLLALFSYLTLRTQLPIWQGYYKDRPDGPRYPIVQGLVGLREQYTSHALNSTVALVLAAQRSDDLTWVLDHCKETGFAPFIFTTEQTPEPGFLRPSTLRGREAPAYLSYIIEFYDKLPDYSLFIHAYPEQWHNDLFGPFTHKTLRNIRYESVDAHGYVNLRCQLDPGCPIAAYPLNPTQTDIEVHDIRAYFAQAYQEIFDVPREKVPAEIGNVCCGQFAVSRDRIRARSKEDYQRILDWIKTTELTNDFGVGWVLEKLWHIIFGMDSVYCPRFEQCRCDNYGWCGPLPSGEVLTAVKKGDP